MFKNGKRTLLFKLYSFIHLYFFKSPSIFFLALSLCARVRVLFSVPFSFLWYSIPTFLGKLKSRSATVVYICLHLSHSILQRSLEIWGIYVPLNFAVESLISGLVPTGPSNFTCLSWQIEIGLLIDFTDLLGRVLPEGSALFSQLSDTAKASLNFKTNSKIDNESIL